MTFLTGLRFLKIIRLWLVHLLPNPLTARLWMMVHSSQPSLLEAAHWTRVWCARPPEFSFERLEWENNRIQVAHWELVSVRRAFFLGGLVVERRLFFILAESEEAGWSERPATGHLPLTYLTWAALPWGWLCEDVRLAWYKRNTRKMYLCRLGRGIVRCYNWIPSVALLMVRGPPCLHCIFNPPCNHLPAANRSIYLHRLIFPPITSIAEGDSGWISVLA